MEDIVDKKQKRKFIDELLTGMVDGIIETDNVYISANFDLKAAVLKNRSFRSNAEKAVEEILDERNEEGIVKSSINDKLYKKLMKGEVIVWSDCTGAVEEKKFDDTLKGIQNREEKMTNKIKDEITKQIITKLAIKNGIINGYLFSSAGKGTILLPSDIKNLKFYEPEDIYDYMGVEIVDRIKDLFVCISNDGAEILPDNHNKKYIGTLVDANKKDLIGIEKLKSVNLKFSGELLMSESNIGK
jgi:hypothetical protein